MSTTPTTEPTQSPTPTAPIPEAPQLDISSPAADLRAAAIAAQETPTPTAPAEPVVTTVAAPEPPPYTVTRGAEGIEVKLASGATYKGATEADDLEKLAAGKFEADRTIRQLRTQAPPAPPPVAPPEPPAPAESPEEIQAREWILEQQAKAFGMTREQYSNAVQGMMQTAHEMQINTLAASFMQRCPDFPNTPEASQIIVGTDTEPGLLQQMGLPATPDGLEAAHLIAVRRGLYKPIPPPVSASQRPTPAPMLNTQGSPQANAEPDLYSMPMDKLRELASRGQ